MIRKITLVAVGALLGASAIALVQKAPNTATAAGTETYRQLAVFGDVFERVRASYVTAPDEKELVRNAIQGMLSSLDPHSSYLDPDAQRDMRVETKGEFGGLGIEVTMENDAVKVIAPIADTPADKAGVLAGDLIIEIDGTEVRGLSLKEAVDMMRGLVNTPIDIKVVRESADRPIDITIIRDIIEIRDVRNRVEGDIGYVRITRFTEKTYDNLNDAITKLTDEIGKDKLKGFVLDLRLNPGGLLNQAINVSDAFLERGKVVSTRGREESDISRFDARAGDLTGGLPVIVMINGGSASASEIVAGALQDHERATILGTQSFGKGSVQTLIPLGENGALRLTTALYYTPSGTSIQGKGITPDIIVEQPLPDEFKGQDVERGESDLRGHIKGEEEDDKGSGSAAYVPADPKDDVQLNHALKLLRGELKDASFPAKQTKIKS